MLELLVYSRANGFKTLIVSGGDIEFTHVWVERIYGIPPEQVMGSSLVTKFETLAGVPVLTWLREVDFIDDNAGKPVAIDKDIGRRPIAAFGHSDGDLQMLQWTAGGSVSRFRLLVNHTDTVREFAYQASTPGQVGGGFEGSRGKGLDGRQHEAGLDRICPFEAGE